jgi:hypothetical protein
LKIHKKNTLIKEIYQAKILLRQKNLIQMANGRMKMNFHSCFPLICIQIRRLFFKNRTICSFSWKFQVRFKKSHPHFSQHQLFFVEIRKKNFLENSSFK